MTIKYKVCTKCGESKPATTEFFHRKRNSIRADCKACASDYARTRSAKPPTYFRWKGIMRRCYEVNHKAYNSYGKLGVSVCEG